MSECQENGGYPLTDLALWVGGCRSRFIVRETTRHRRRVFVAIERLTTRGEGGGGCETTDFSIMAGLWHHGPSARTPDGRQNSIQSAGARVSEGMRIIVNTGKGGVGKTSIAAATAVRTAETA